MIIACCVCTDRDDEGVLYPLLHGLNRQKRHDVYWRCAAVSLASFARTSHGNELVLYTDADFRQSAPQNVINIIEEIGIVVIKLPFDHFRPPSGVSSRFRNAFYKLEVIHDLSRGTQSAMLVDTDVVAIRNMDQLGFDSGAFLHIYEPYADSWSPEHSTEFGDFIEQLFDERKTLPTRYAGGEFIAGSVDRLAELSSLAKEAFDRACHLSKSGELRARGDGKSIFDNDEFVLSAAVNQLDYYTGLTSGAACSVTSNHRLRRIYTNTRYFTAVPSDVDLILWHLPAEKTRGFGKVFRSILDSESWFWTATPELYIRDMGMRMGVPNRSMIARYCYAALAFSQRIISQFSRTT